MEKKTYKNEMNYKYDAKHPVAHYYLNEYGVYRSRGEMIESIIKTHYGLFTIVNKNTSWKNGSDIESMKASVKSARACIGRNFDGIEDPNKQLRYYFKNVASDMFIWGIWDEKVEMMTEYRMNKKEFGAFVRLFTYYTSDSKMKCKAIRFRGNTKKMRKWLEDQCI